MECGSRLASGGPPAEAATAPPAVAIEPSAEQEADRPPPFTAQDQGLPRVGGPQVEARIPVQAGRVPSPSELPANHPEWRMSPAGPLPEQPRRRWVIWLVGALGVCILLCVAVVVWSSTVGRPTIDAIATQVVVESTRQAEGQ